MFRLKSKGNFEDTTRYLEKVLKREYVKLLDDYGRRGVQILANATPERTGVTAASWDYRVVDTKQDSRVEWFNNNVNDGAVVALLIQYGHGTGTGGYVQGFDYINPALAPLFKEMAEEIWNEVI